MDRNCNTWEIYVSMIVGVMAVPTEMVLKTIVPALDFDIYIISIPFGQGANAAH